LSSVEAGRSPDAEKIVRALTRRVRSDLAQRQRRAGVLRVRMTTVFEALDRKKREKFWLKSRQIAFAKRRAANG
jgi:hypothetical protein